MSDIERKRQAENSRAAPPSEITSERPTAARRRRVLQTPEPEQTCFMPGKTTPQVQDDTGPPRKSGDLLPHPAVTRVPSMNPTSFTSGPGNPLMPAGNNISLSPKWDIRSPDSRNTVDSAAFIHRAEQTRTAAFIRQRTAMDEPSAQAISAGDRAGNSPVFSEQHAVHPQAADAIRQRAATPPEYAGAAPVSHSTRAEPVSPRLAVPVTPNSAGTTDTAHQMQKDDSARPANTLQRADQARANEAIRHRAGIARTGSDTAYAKPDSANVKPDLPGHPAKRGLTSDAIQRRVSAPPPVSETGTAGGAGIRHSSEPCPSEYIHQNSPEAPDKRHISRRDPGIVSDEIPAGRRRKSSSSISDARRAVRTDDAGNQAAHRRRHHSEANGRHRKSATSHSTWIRLGIIALLAGTALFSLVMISRIAFRSIRTDDLYTRLAEKHTQAAAGVDPQKLVIYTLPDIEASSPEGSEEAAPDDLLSLYEALVDAELTETASDPAPGRTMKQPQAVTTTMYHRIGGDALPEMAALYYDNTDLIGWINISGVLDLPVVYRDNSYYLKHDFNKQKNTSGTIFLDENHPFKARTQNLLIHGHNMRDGSMFGRLVQYKSNPSFLRTNCLIDFSSIWAHETYVIFAVLQVSMTPSDPAFLNYFTHATFRTDAAFAAYIDELASRSMYAVPVDVRPEDALITLSTCLDKDRLIIVARRCRENETPQRLRELVSASVRQ